MDVNFFEADGKESAPRFFRKTKSKSAFQSALFLFVLVFQVQIFAATQIPAFSSPVIDDAGVLSSSAKREIEQYLQAVNTQTQVQIALFIVKSLNGESIESLSLRAAEQWKLGQKDKDNGVLLTVAMKERELRIEVGYGLEGVLTDAKCGIIIRKFIVPSFKNGNYEEGIKNGIKIIAGYATGNAEIKTRVDSVKQGLASEADGVPLISIFILLCFLFLIASQAGGGAFGFFAFLPFLGGFRFSRRSRRFYGSPRFFNNDDDDDFKGGGFGGSGFRGGSGGFKGGGGHFGGGGASGKW